MKYSFISFSCPEFSLDEILALAKQLGYQGIEPRSGSGHKHGIELETSAVDRSTIRMKVAESGVDLCCLAISCRYADPETVEGQVEETYDYIDLASDLQIPRLRVFGGMLAEGLSREAAVDQLVEALEPLASHAEQQNVTICIETHDDWSDPKDVAAVLERVDHPNLAVNWDIMHPVRKAGLDIDQSFQILKPWIKHVHIHDGTKELDKLVFQPIGQGDIDHKRTLEVLIAHGYDGYLSGEWIGWEPPEVHLPRELATMRQYEVEIGRA